MKNHFVFGTFGVVLSPDSDILVFLRNPVVRYARMLM
jgi:hypothetical protein